MARNFDIAITIRALDMLSAPLRRMQENLTQFDKLARAADGLRQWGERTLVTGALVSGAAQKMAGALGQALQPAMAVEDALAKVATVAPGNLAQVGEALQTVRGEAMAWSRGHADSAESFIESTYQMLSAGLDLNPALAATRTAMTLARGTMGDAGEAAQTLATLYNNMGDRTKDAQGELTRMGDALAKTQAMFQIADLGTLNEGLKYAAAGANNANVGFEQMLTLVGALNNAGITGGQAGTSFNALLRQLEKASAKLKFGIAIDTKTGEKDVIRTLQNFQKQFGDVGKLGPKMTIRVREAFGDEAMLALGALAKQAEKLPGWFDAVGQSAGEAARMAAFMEGTLSARLGIVKNRALELADSLGAQLAPVVRRLEGPFTAVLNAAQRLIETHPGVVRWGAALGVAATAAMGLGGAMLVANGTLAVFAGHTLSAVVALGKLGAGMRLLAMGQWALVFGGVAGSIAGIGKAVLFAVPPLALMAATFALVAMNVRAVIRHWDELTAKSNPERWEELNRKMLTMVPAPNVMYRGQQTAFTKPLERLRKLAGEATPEDFRREAMKELRGVMPDADYLRLGEKMRTEIDRANLAGKAAAPLKEPGVGEVFGEFLEGSFWGKEIQSIWDWFKVPETKAPDLPGLKGGDKKAGDRVKDALKRTEDLLAQIDEHGGARHLEQMRGLDALKPAGGGWMQAEDFARLLTGVTREPSILRDMTLTRLPERWWEQWRPGGEVLRPPALPDLELLEPRWNRGVPGEGAFGVPQRLMLPEISPLPPAPPVLETPSGRREETAALEGIRAGIGELVAVASRPERPAAAPVVNIHMEGRTLTAREVERAVVEALERVARHQGRLV